MLRAQFIDIFRQGIFFIKLVSVDELDVLHEEPFWRQGEREREKWKRENGMEKMMVESLRVKNT